MTFLSEQEKEKIRFAIAEAESRTSGEIATVITNSSDAYRFIPTLWAAVLALTVPGIVFLVAEPLSAVLTYQIQVLFFIGYCDIPK